MVAPDLRWDNRQVVKDWTQCNLLFSQRKPSIVTPVRVRSDKRHWDEKETEGKEFGTTKDDLTAARNSRDSNGEKKKESRVFQLLTEHRSWSGIQMIKYVSAIKKIELKLWTNVRKNTISQQNLLFCYSTPTFKWLFLNPGQGSKFTVANGHFATGSRTFAPKKIT